MSTLNECGCQTCKLLAEASGKRLISYAELVTACKESKEAPEQQVACYNCNYILGSNPHCSICEDVRAKRDDSLKQPGKPPEPATAFPGTAGMYTSQHKLAVTEDWMRGWNACLDAIDRLGGFKL